MDELEDNEKEFTVYQYTDEGWKLWNCFNALQNSSTRCELGAALVAMIPAKAVSIAIDNKGVVTKGTDIIEHVKKRRSTKLHEDNEEVVTSSTANKITPRLGHIDLTLAYLHYEHTKEVFQAVQTPSRIQIANMGTKPESGPSLMRSECIVMG